MCKCAHLFLQEDYPHQGAKLIPSKPATCPARIIVTVNVILACQGLLLVQIVYSSEVLIYANLLQERSNKWQKLDEMSFVSVQI